MGSIADLYSRAMKIKNLPSRVKKRMQDNQKTYRGLENRFRALADDFYVLISNTKREMGESVEDDELEPISEIKTFEYDEIDEESDRAMQLHAKLLSKMTDYNDHSGAVLYLAQKVLKDKKLTKIAKAIQDIHQTVGSMPYHLGQFRSTEFWNGWLEPAAKRKLSPEDYTLIMNSF
jgi:hypothetical protein